MHTKLRYVFFFAVSLTAALAAVGEERTFVFQQGTDGYTGLQDTTIFSEVPNASGATPIISAGMNKEGGLRRALLRVDLASIPAGATITSATLELHVERAPDVQPPTTFALHRLTAGWNEGTTAASSGGGGSGDPAVDGDTTWISRAQGATAWTNPGGDFLPEPSSSTDVGDTGSIAKWSGAGLVADVQAWVEHPDTNFGWIMLGPETTNRRLRRFHSKEAGALGPKVTVVAEVPTSQP